MDADEFAKLVFDDAQASTPDHLQEHLATLGGVLNDNFLSLPFGTDPAVLEALALPRGLKVFFGVSPNDWDE